MPILNKNGDTVSEIITTKSGTEKDIRKVTSFDVEYKEKDVVDFDANITDPTGVSEGNWYIFILPIDDKKYAIGHSGTQLYHYLIKGDEVSFDDKLIWTYKTVGSKKVLMSRDGYYMKTGIATSSSTSVKVTTDETASDLADITFSTNFSTAHKEGYLEIVDKGTYADGKAINDAYDRHQILIWWYESYGYQTYQVTSGGQVPVFTEKTMFNNGISITGEITDSSVTPRAYMNSTYVGSNTSPTGGNWVELRIPTFDKTSIELDLTDVDLVGMAFMFNQNSPSDANSRFVKSITIPSGIDTSNVRSMHRMFYCGSPGTSYTTLERIYGLENLDLSNCVSIRTIFQNQNVLKSVEGIEDWDVSKCDYFSSVFRNCSSLTSVDISNWDMSKSTSNEEMFYGCSKLHTLKLPQIGTGTSDLNTRLMFGGCSVLTNIQVCGDVYNSLDFSSTSRLKLDSAKVVLRSLKTPYSGSQTITFSTSVLNTCLSDNEATGLIWDAIGKGWNFAGMVIPDSVFKIESGDIQEGLTVENYVTHQEATEYEAGKYYTITDVSTNSVDFSGRNVVGGIDISEWDVDTIDVTDNQELSNLAFKNTFDGELTIKAYGTGWFDNLDKTSFVEMLASYCMERDLTLYFTGTIQVGDMYYETEGIGHITVHFASDGTFTIDWADCEKYYYDIDLDSVRFDDTMTDWVVSTYATPSDAPEGSTVYMSNSNYHIHRSFAKAKFIAQPGKRIELYINSYAETSYDYTIAFGLDVDYTSSNIPDSTSTGVVASTMGHQFSPVGTLASSYTKVTYDTPDDGNEHFILVIYRKDGSVDSFFDRGSALAFAKEKVIVRCIHH